VPSETNLQRLDIASSDLASVEWERVERPELGRRSLATELGDQKEAIGGIVALVTKYGKHVHDEIVVQIADNLDSIRHELENQAALEDSTYLETSEEFLDSLSVQIEESKRWEPYIISAAILERGLLDIEDLRDRLEQAQAESDKTAKESLEALQAQSDEILRKAKEQAEEIVGHARLTAEGISVKQAQEQFRDAAKQGRNQVILWSILAGTAVTALIATIYNFMQNTSPVGVQPWTASVHYTLIRVFLLSAVAGVTAFTFRILRARLHILERNRHRVRVANSIESFLQSAADQSQRDLILVRLTESIVNYGDSGLVRNEREERSATMSGDILARIVAAISGKGGG